MKQHITKKQWDELSYEQKESLLEHKTFYDFDEGQIYVEDMDEYIDTGNKIDIFIGQMIEFLGDDLAGIYKGDGMDKIEGWSIEKFTLTDDFKMPDYYNTNELCDALWEAVKYKLK